MMSHSSGVWTTCGWCGAKALIGPDIDGHLVAVCVDTEGCGWRHPVRSASPVPRPLVPEPTR
jgi:hypothetical protein